MKVSDQLGEVLVVQVTDGQVDCNRERPAALDPGAGPCRGSVQDVRVSAVISPVRSATGMNSRGGQGICEGAATRKGLGALAPMMMNL